MAFFGKNLTNVISKENCATFLSGNQYDRLSQQSFLVAVASLSNKSREKYINTTQGRNRRKNLRWWAESAPPWWAESAPPGGDRVKVSEN